MNFALYQAPFEQTAFGYTAAADYKRVWAADFEGELPPDVTEALEAIWTGFQRVDPETGPWPPEGYEGRSLSVGDVIVLDGWAAFAVEGVGFAVVPSFDLR